MVHQSRSTSDDNTSLRIYDTRSDLSEQESRGLLTDLRVEKERIQSLRWKATTIMTALTILNIALFSLSVMFFGATWYSQTSSSKNAELRRVSVYSELFSCYSHRPISFSLTGQVLYTIR